MKNYNEQSRNYSLYVDTRLNLIALILLIIILVASIAKAQGDLRKGIEIFENKNYYGAKRFFNDYLKVHPEEAAAYYYLGRIAMEEQDLEAATDHFDKAVDIDDSRSEYFTWKGIAYVQLLSTVDFMQQGIYAPRALNALETAVSLDPNNIDARMWLAGYYTNAPVFAGGSQEKTKEQYEAILEIDPAFVPGYINYGLALMGFEEYDPAFENFEKALEYDPENYSVYLFIGQLSAESGKYTTQGELSLKKFIDLAPEAFEDSIDDAWWYLGTIYMQKGNAEDARKAYEKAITLDPENEDYQKSLKNLM